MKLASLLAGVAVVALSATAVSAQSLGGFSRGQYTTPTTGSINLNAVLPGAGSVSYAVASGTTNNVPSGNWGPIGDAGENIANTLRANNSESRSAAWHATGVSVGNVGGAGERFDNATFSLQGTVATDCAFYTGTSNSLSFDFGQIGIYTSDNTGAAAAFTMVAPAAMNFDTNLAGCNTASTVSISKNDIRGLVNQSGSGYDTDVFQANLPYIVAARYTAPSTNTAAQGELQTLTVASDANAARSAQHGAWKSSMDIQVTVPQADLALVAGQYTGNFTVTVAAL